MKDFVPRRTEKEVISIRIDSDTLKVIDAAAERSKISRNEFINQCIQFALSHLSMEN